MNIPFFIPPYEYWWVSLSRDVDNSDVNDLVLRKFSFEQVQVPFVCLWANLILDLCWVMKRSWSVDLKSSFIVGDSRFSLDVNILSISNFLDNIIQDSPDGLSASFSKPEGVGMGLI